LNDIKSRNVIFDSKANTYNSEGILNLSVNEGAISKGDQNELMNNEDLLIIKSNNNTINISNRKNSNISKNGHVGKENINKFPDKSSETINYKESSNGLEQISESEKEEKLKALNLNDTLIIDEQIEKSSNINLNSKENKENIEKKSQLTSVLKNIITIDIIMSLKVLKNDIKEYFERYSINIFNNTNNEFDFSVIGVQEQNIKFSEFLKIGTFNDIYENILSKYFNEFYKSIFREKEFLLSLEKILVHYFKINNKMEEKEHKIINFNDVIKTFAQKN